jgi:hypothetical protein
LLLTPTYTRAVFIFNLISPAGPADGWSIFDTVVIAVSIALIATPGGGGNAWIKQLRVRAERMNRQLN